MASNISRRVVDPVRVSWTRQTRFYASEADCEESSKKGLVVGVYDGSKLTKAAKKVDGESGGRLNTLIKGGSLGLGEARVVNNISDEFQAVAVVGLGREGLGYNEDEALNEGKENTRIAMGNGAQLLQEMKISKIFVEDACDAEAAAEGAILGVWNYQKYKQPQNREPESTISLYAGGNISTFFRGKSKAEAQNTARALEQAPANNMTPSSFAQEALKILCPNEVQVEARDREWIEQKNMTAITGIARSSSEPPLFLEMTYNGGTSEDKPVLLVGKGVTFDAGGVCLRKAEGMAEYRADMAGAAVCVGVMKAISSLKLPINVIALAPLCENMPGGSAAKPGDVVIGMNQKSIRVHRTDHEGRVLLADALTYSGVFNPCLVASIATLTSGIRTALGESSTGVFCNSKAVWKEMEKAGAESGDRVWRMPMWKFFCHRITYHKAYDVCNRGGTGGTPSAAAAFLMQFVPPIDFVHLDITGTGMLSTGIGFPYLREGMMTGRPTRTITQFLQQMTVPED